MENEEKARIKTAAHEYANPKTKVIQSYTRLFDAFESGAKWAHESQAKTIEQLIESHDDWKKNCLEANREIDRLKALLTEAGRLLDTANQNYIEVKKEVYFLENEKDGLIQENKKLRETFCSCSSEVKTGNIQVKHCNICGKIEPEETWFKVEE